MNRPVWTNAFAAALLCGAGAWADDAAADLFETLDKNKDGQVEKSEVDAEHARHLERLLRSGDQNEDGKLSQDEFSKAGQDENRPVEPGPGAGSGGRGRGEMDPRKFFERLDTNQDGKLSKDEATADEVPPFARERLAKLFEESGKAEITIAEFGKARLGAGSGGGREMLERMKKMDKNSDGKVTKDEVPEEARERMQGLFDRLGKDEIDLERLGEMQAQGGNPPGGRPFGRPPEGDKPKGGRAEGGRPGRPPADGEGDRPRPPRDGDGEMRRPEGDEFRGPPEGGPGGSGRRPHMPKFAHRLDKDQDGRISADELAHATKVLQELDENSDGFLDMAELLGPPPGGMRGPMGGGQGGPDGRGGPREGRRPDGDGDRPRRPEGDGEGANREDDRPRDGERPPEDQPRDDKSI